jgi:diguanylate cyclase (GGDEF)-like protein
MLRASSLSAARGRPDSWKRFAVAFAALVGAFLLLPDGSWPQSAAFGVIGVGVAVAGARAARDARPALPWRLLLVGVAANALGTPVQTFLVRVLGSDTFPSLADVFYLSLYPAVGIGLALLVRRLPGVSLAASVLDSCTIAAGAGLVSWIVLIHPLANNDELDLAGRAVSMAYPLADLVLLVLATRLLLVTSLRSGAYRMVFAAVVCLLTSDTAWGVINKAGWELGPWADKGLQLLALAAYGLVALAALHPAARESPPEAALLSAGLRPPMLAALTLAALTAPTVLAIEAARGQVTDGLAVAIGSAVLFLLVVARMAGLIGQVERQAGLLRELALVDELTGLANRRALMTELGRSLEQARRSGEPLSLAVLDLDHFKQFNDLFGHVEGDRLLATAAHAWQRRLRGSDLLARYGGEEFVVLLPGTSAGTAGAVLGELRAVTPAGLTFSGGLAEWQPGETSAALITRADQALYAAKAQGRDQVVVAMDDPPSRVPAS